MPLKVDINYEKKNIEEITAQIPKNIQTEENAEAIVTELVTYFSSAEWL